MNGAHPNLAVLQQFDPTNIAGAADILTEDAVFHYYNPKLPDMQGDYVGLEGFKAFFEEIGKRSKGTFKVNPVFASAVGDELVFVHSMNTLILEDQQTEIDVVVIFRVVEGKITEVWDIPSAYTDKSINLNTQS
ncbi:MAG: nuclear transport factor 2 family protein [Cyclobacteriaceae bacterium]